MAFQLRLREHVVPVLPVRVADEMLLQVDRHPVFKISRGAGCKQAEKCPCAGRFGRVLVALDVDHGVKAIGIRKNKPSPCTTGQGLEESGVRDDIPMISPAAVALRHASCPKPFSDFPGLMPVGLARVVVEKDRKGGQHVGGRQVRLVVHGETMMQVIDGRSESILVDVPLLLELFKFRLVAIDALGPASRHGFQFWWIAVERRPLCDEVEAHENGVYATQGEQFFSNFLAKLLRHRAHIQLSHKGDGPVSGGDAHSLGIDPDEHLTDFSVSRRTYDDQGNR